METEAVERPLIREAGQRLAFDARPVARRIGLVLLATDHTSERDFARLLPADEAAAYCTRIPYANPTTPANLRAMQPRLAEAAALILPGEDLDALCFSCTSASVVIGDSAVATALQAGKPGVAVVTPPGAAVAGLRARGVRRPAILTPYTRETSAPLLPYFRAAGFEPARLTCLGLDDDRQMARISLQSLILAAESATPQEADGLFISCTALRAAEVVEEIENRIGRPVVTSNQASVWMCMRLAGMRQRPPGAGALFDHDLPG